jgi:hypothetical protein
MGLNKNINLKSTKFLLASIKRTSDNIAKLTKTHKF